MRKLRFIRVYEDDFLPSGTCSAIGTAAAILGSSVISAVAGSSAARSAANAQVRASDQATAEQQRQYDQTRADYAPWRATGESALGRLNAASTGDNSNFFASPDYNFTRTEGQRDIGNSFAARGGAASGNALRALTEFNQNLASRQYGNWWDRQAGLAGIGFNGTSATAQAGQNAANNISGNYLAAGDARASGVLGSANSWMNTANSGLQNWLLFRGGYFDKPKGA
jgi:hypothetical protein